MNVLHINHSDIEGGAAIAGYRLHQGLLSQGFRSKLLVGTVKTDDDRVAAVPRRPGWEKQLYRFTWYSGLNNLNYVGSFDVPKHPFYKEADIINFHNIHTGYFTYLTLPSLTKTKPAIYTLHDMWSFTGHCAYSFDCERWKIGCGKCPYPDAVPAIGRDNTRLEWKLKEWVYSRSNLTIVTPSRWLTEQAQKSLLSCFSIHYIPYGIDTETYQPLDPEQCRSLLGIPNNKYVLLFVAQRLTETRKGGEILIKALEKLPKSIKDETVLLTIGDSSNSIAKAVGIPTLSLGYVSSDRLKSIAYSAADIFVFPTRADNLPLVLQESMACGTPIISYKVGGVPDLVRPGITGYLAEPENSNELCSGILELLENEELRVCMSQNCRQIALEEYSLELQAQRYVELYHQILQNCSLHPIQCYVK